MGQPLFFGAVCDRIKCNVLHDYRWESQRHPSHLATTTTTKTTTTTWSTCSTNWGLCLSLGRSKRFVPTWMTRTSLIQRTKPEDGNPTPFDWRCLKRTSSEYGIQSNAIVISLVNTGPHVCTFLMKGWIESTSLEHHIRGEGHQGICWYPCFKFWAWLKTTQHYAATAAVFKR